MIVYIRLLFLNHMIGRNHMANPLPWVAAIILSITVIITVIHYDRKNK